MTKIRQYRKHCLLLTGSPKSIQECYLTRFRLSALLCLLSLFSTVPLSAQQNTTTANAVVPQLVNSSGGLSDTNGKPLAGTVGVTFSLYKDQQGGAPLWVETQNVQLDKSGHYSVMLGSTSSAGLPADIFVAGEARWLGVQAQGQAEQPRALLTSVPYALKAADAQTIGGLPPSAFVLAAPNGAGTTSASSAAATSGSAGAPPLGGSGTVNYIPIWTDSTGDLGNSVLFQSGTGAKAKVGIGTTKPASTLDVKGGSTIRGLFSLPATGTATATAGFNSQPMDLAASVFNSGTSTAVTQTFQWQAEPVGNDTSNASGSLNLLFGQGTSKPTETGLNIASNGQITFAKGQTFPGTGTVTNVGSGLGLTGGPITSTGTLSIDTSVVPQLGSGNNFIGNQTVNGNVSATQLISKAAQGTAPLNVTSTTQVPNLNASFLDGFSASAFQVVGSYATLGANTFTGDQSVQGNVTATATVGGSAINASTSFNLRGNPFAFGSLSSQNAFLGFSGNLSTTGTRDTANGYSALLNNTSGANNTAAGAFALTANTTGGENAATGYSALSSNTTGSDNTADGAGALSNNTTGSYNTGDGTGALIGNTTGSYNTASGENALLNNTTGDNNTALGFIAGNSTNNQSTTGSGDTFVGFNANSGTQTNLNNATAIGANAQVTASNAMVLGSINGVNGATASTNVGIGTTAPAFTLDVHGTGNFTGLVNFASGQTFPGTVGSVTAGTDLTNTGTSSNPLLNVDTTKVVTAVFGGTDLTGGGTGGVQTLNLDTTKVPLLIANNNFTGNQTVSGTVTSASPSSTTVGGAFYGFSAALNSGISGTAGLTANGGSGDAADNDTGGDGVNATGGSAGASAGHGLSGTGGNSTFSAGGAGVAGYGGWGNYGDGSGGVFFGSAVAGEGGDGVDAVWGSGYAGVFTGDLVVNGAIYASTKDFKIDHPLDPANKYLVHASVESSEMMNIYTGNVITDSQGEATVQLPEWFEVLNTDFRYQLTVIGQFAQAIVAREIQNHQFQIRTNAPSVKVSWQVTGVRQDAFAKAHPLVVEKEKEARLRGFYSNPELYGAPEEKQIEWARHPEMMKQMKERREKQLGEGVHPQPAENVSHLSPDARPVGGNQQMTPLHPAPTHGR
jgi:hypothetical protein